MNTSRCAIVLGVLLAAGGCAVVWAADTITVPPPPAATQADVAANTAEARTHLSKAVNLYYQQNKVQEASDEVNAALALDPNLRDAQTLRAIIDQKTGGGGGGEVAPDNNRKVLTKAEISRIKFNEITQADLDKGVTGSVPREALEDFWQKVVLKDTTQTDTSQADHDKFINPSNFRGQLEKLKSEQATAYYGKVIINTDPASMADFRRTVEPFIVKNCMTSGCHSGQYNNGFPFITKGTNPIATSYTNFYLMNSLAVGGNNMIDRANPTNSLFIQYAMDPKNAQVLHPGKPDLFHRRFGNIDDAAAQVMVNWVKSLRFPAPDYGISLPIPATTTPPAPATATAPAH